jgi:hypothetical protein
LLDAFWRLTYARRTAFAEVPSSPAGNFMLLYWLLFALFATGAILSTGGDPFRAQRPSPMILVAGIFVVILVGLRFQVGADWRSYEFMFSFAGYADLGRVIKHGDAGYQTLNWLVQRADYKIWVVNLVCAIIFTWGLLRLARTQPLPWLAVTVAIPYLVIVVAMGYSRQAVAIGIVMAGLAALARGASLVRFAIYVAVAALFHKTAVVMLPLLVFTSERNRFLNALAAIAGFVLLYDVFLADDVDKLVKNYVEAEYSSQGAAIRVAMSLVPAAVMLLRGRRLGLSSAEVRIWRAFSWTSIGLLVLLILSPSSTAVDRIALYMLPLQVIVLPRTVALFRSPQMGRLIVVAYAAAIQFTWLNFATHAIYWVPYHFFPFGA